MPSQGAQHADPCVVDQDVDRPGGLDGLTDAFRIGDVEGEHAQTLGTGQNVLARRAHRGDDLPVAIEEVPGDFEAETGRASGDQDGFHGELL